MFLFSSSKYCHLIAFTTQRVSTLHLRVRNVLIYRSSVLEDFFRLCQSLVCFEMVSLKWLLLRLFKASPFKAT